MTPGRDLRDRLAEAQPVFEVRKEPVHQGPEASAERIAEPHILEFTVEMARASPPEHAPRFDG